MNASIPQPRFDWGQRVNNFRGHLRTVTGMKLRQITGARGARYEWQYLLSRVTAKGIETWGWETESLLIRNNPQIIEEPSCV